MPPKLRIALISRDRGLTYRLEVRLQSRDCQVVSIEKLSTVLGFLYTDPPDLLIFDLPDDGEEARAVLRELKRDSYFSVIPVIGLLRSMNGASFDWAAAPLDDFVVHPVDFDELYSRITLSLQRVKRVFDNNPLTKLPGNTSIHAAIEESLGKPLAVCYLDINNFKPYNDTYGFSRGDEVLRMTGRILSNAVKESREGGFVGHVGGDDFVFIVPAASAEALCKSIIDKFTVIVADFFNEDDKARGHYRAKDRTDKVQTIPLLGIAIAVVPVDSPTMLHAGKVAEVAAELKKFAKKKSGSSFVVDRRRRPPEPSKE